MSDSAHKDQVREIVDGFDKCAAAFASHLKKARDRIVRFKKAFDRHPTTKELTKLVAELRPYANAPEKPDVAALGKELDRQLDEMRRALKDSLGDQLRRACSTAQLPFKTLPDGFGLGPFLLTLNPANEEGALAYAKVVAAKGIPMDPEACVTQAKALKATILDEPSDLARLRSTVEEAMRVALARKNKSFKGELRVELPHVFREMEIIRQPDRGSAANTASRYSLPRFVVELARLVQSESNLESAKPLRLETAVLENTKDPRRSLFIPKDLACGYGEGTYYQALTLLTD